MAIEREIKLTADVELVLPVLADLPGITMGPVSKVRLDAVYYDTPALAMARWGVTLRARTGEPGPVWTLKVAAPNDGPGLSRHEFTFDEPPGVIPVDAVLASRALTRGQSLGPVVRLRTERTSSRSKQTAGRWPRCATTWSLSTALNQSNRSARSSWSLHPSTSMQRPSKQ